MSGKLSWDGEDGEGGNEIGVTRACEGDTAFSHV